MAESRRRGDMIMSKPITDNLYLELLSAVRIQLNDHDPREVIPAFQKLIQMRFSADEAHRILMLHLLNSISEEVEDESVNSLQLYRNELRRIAKGYYSAQDLKEQLEQISAASSGEAYAEGELLNSFLLYYLGEDYQPDNPHEGAGRYLALSEEERLEAVSTLAHLGSEDDSELEHAWDLIDLLRDDLVLTGHNQELAEFSRMVLDEFEEKELLEPEDRADLMTSEGEGLLRSGNPKEAETILVRVPFVEDDVELMTVLIHDLVQIGTDKSKKRAEKILDKVIGDYSDYIEDEPELAESLLNSARSLNCPEHILDFLESVPELDPEEGSDLSDLISKTLMNHSILALRDMLIEGLETNPVPEAEEALKDFRERGFSEEQSRLLIALGFLIRAQQKTDHNEPVEGADLMAELPQAMNDLMDLDDEALKALLEEMSFSGLSERIMTLEHLLMQNRSEEAVSYYEAHEEELFAELTEYIQEEQMDYGQLCEAYTEKGICFGETIFALLDALSEQNQEEKALKLLEQLKQTIEITDPDDQDMYLRYEILLNDELDRTQKADRLMEGWQKMRMNCTVQRTILDLLMRRNQKMDAKRAADQFMKGPIADDDLSAGDLLKSIRKVYLAVNNKKLAKAAEKKYRELGYEEEDLEDDPEFRFYN